MIEYLQNLWMTMESLSFWLLIGVLVAGLLHLWVPNDFIKKHLGHGGLSTVLKAVLIGVPMPLCSCGVIPAGLGIKRQGAGNGAGIGFLISTPQTGVDSIAVSASMLGLPFALFKLFSAFVTGWIGGIIVHLTEPAKSVEEISEEAASNGDARPERTVKELFAFSVDDVLRMIWRWLLIGVVVSAALDTWLPGDFFQTYFPDNKLLLMGAMLLVSMPMYVCATASVPLAAALIHKGMPVGAALVLLMAGPATNVATLGAVYKGFGLKNLLIYLVTIIVGSMGLGLAFEFVIPPHMAEMALHEHAEHWVGATVAAVVLTALMVRFSWLDLKAGFKKSSSAEAQEDTLELSVGGMTCMGCAGKVDKALRGMEGVASVAVSLEDACVVVTGSGLDRNSLADTIRSKGFTVPDDEKKA